MKAKPVIPRALAQQDVEEAVSYYLSEDAEQAALGFIDALELAYTHIGRRPATGSPRYAHELDLPGLRCWSLKRYPHIVFYIERDDHIDVWRVLHGMRDIPAWLHLDATAELANDVAAGRKSAPPKPADEVFSRLVSKYRNRIEH
ncbi:type II toxin-antitoxin system RelE/ParE family toxin [Ralstonia solanacearum]|nr:type II toxin-antitoxin system RelE/ParE family toxin [Ralstonia solanacearum]MBB6586054.1 type II toxin-antitoxin system RelE/ParE family toxin [Ralstonia solanacearum]QNT25206.1 type II toxin-antitoxin system RelE/ParE family toxin [Ralstonia solanacearum]QNT62849.1 type II toxin-antitoxin system RelE/ParE family toxin [Ralstonia solanacearum]